MICGSRWLHQTGSSGEEGYDEEALALLVHNFRISWFWMNQYPLRPGPRQIIRRFQTFPFLSGCPFYMLHTQNHQNSVWDSVLLSRVYLLLRSIEQNTSHFWSVQITERKSMHPIFCIKPGCRTSMIVHSYCRRRPVQNGFSQTGLVARWPWQQ